MAETKQLYSPKPSSVVDENFDVDYVIVYRFAKTAQAEAESQFIKLIQALSDVGLTCEVRTGDNYAVLVFVKVASAPHLNAEVYRSRVQDWLYGVRTSAPEKNIQKSLEDEPVTQAERLRLVYLLITKAQNEGGAGITPKSGEWNGVESVFPLHDHAFNKAWIKQWSTKYLISFEDLNVIRNRFGEKIAFYFAFLQAYFLFLIFPAIFGISCWLFFGQFSSVYAIVNLLGCVIFVEYWKKQEVDLAVQWGVRGVSKIQQKRPEFKHETEIKDAVTGETIKIFSPVKRLGRQMLQVPFALIATALLGGLICLCFSIEIFISEVYTGPFKSYLTYLPTVLLTTLMPTLSTLLTEFAAKLTDFENYENTDSHQTAFIQKIFVMNFITSYLGIFLTAFVYVPFAKVIVPHLNVFNLTINQFTENEKQVVTPKAAYEINPDRLKKQLIYCTVTAQVINFALEVVVPYVKRKVFQTVKQVRANGGAAAAENHAAKDVVEEKSFLKRVRDEAELDVYDVTGDFREMIVQFGYLSLFSVVWPLTAVSFLINNWIELRADALKITIECQRPVPWRADSIGPWLDSLGFLTWVGSLTTAALVFLFRDGGLGPDGSPWNVSVWGLLLTIFFSEHIYLVVQLAVRKALSKIDSPGLQKERAQRFSIRKQYLQEAMGQEAAEKVFSGGIVSGEKLDRESLEESARQSTLSGKGTTSDRFWQRQHNVAETLEVGRQLIAKAAPSESKKKQ